MTRGVIVLSALLLGGCMQPTATCEASRSLLGTWRYAGTQDATAPVVLNGTLQITSESCEGFEGRLDIVEADGTGGSRRLAGPVTGRLTGAASLRFDVWFAISPREHVATLEGETAEGNWIIGGGVSGPMSGTFRIIRMP